MGFYRKIQTEGWGYTFLKTGRNFKFFHCLYPYRSPVEKAAVWYPWKLGNSAKLCDTLWKFQEIKNQDPWKFHMSFLVLEHPRKFPIFLIWPLDFPATCSFSSITIGGWGGVIWLVHFHFLLNSPKLKGLAARAAIMDYNDLVKWLQLIHQSFFATGCQRGKIYLLQVSEFFFS